MIEQWRKWNDQGFIPGPEEGEKSFQERIAFCENLEQNLQQNASTKLPFEKNNDQSQEILEEALPFTQKLYGIQPRWVPLFFNNHQLAPWHGGCAWIFQLNEQTPTASFLQLRARFLTSKSFLGIYQSRELVAHELAHVGRMLYQEPQFEEFFAYQSSSSKLTRWLGPIVQTSRESFFFILLLGLVVLTDVALISVGAHMPLLSWGLKLLVGGLIVYALARLIYRHHVLNLCLKKLKILLPSHQAKHFLYRLRDKEIKQFSRSAPSKIHQYIEQGAENSFRWRFLKALYPFSKTHSDS